ncbi:MAG: glycine cleavage system regulatory protein [Bradymonadia bacterium]|jgi:glycine cleavage system regulatory protein
MQRLALTLIAPDKPGIVELVAKTVSAHGGNWLESQMTRLAGRFAGVLLVEVSKARAAELETALTSLEGLTVSVQLANEVPIEGERVRLSVLGNDRPGIVQQVSAVLASAAINVESLQTSTKEAPVSGGVLFEAIAEVYVPEGVEIEGVRATLEEIANDLMVDIQWGSQQTEP